MGYDTCFAQIQRVSLNSTSGPTIHYKLTSGFYIADGGIDAATIDVATPTWSYEALIPFKHQRHIQLDIKTSSHIKHSLPAADIIDGCIFQPA
jgi:hypothetical protein